MGGSIWNAGEMQFQRMEATVIYSCYCLREGPEKEPTLPERIRQQLQLGVGSTGYLCPEPHRALKMTTSTLSCIQKPTSNECS